MTDQSVLLCKNPLKTKLFFDFFIFELKLHQHCLHNNGKYYHKKFNFFSGLNVRCPTLDGRLFMFNLQMEVFYEMFDFGEGF
jgi:hypothetical protein